MRILVADDHGLVRQTVASYLARDGGFDTREAATLDDALERIAADGPFDLVLLDLRMPGGAGLGAIGRVAAANGGRPVALMSGTAERGLAHAALAAGAAGFLPKTLPARTLLNAVRFMLAGERFVPAGEGGAPAESGGASPLTARERQVLDGLARGLANKEIARDLNLHEITVKLHVRSLCRKLAARNRTHAAMIARDRALL